MLEIDTFWYPILVAQFLVLLYVLNVILFKPMLKVFGERDEAISGSLDAAKEMEIEREDKIAALKKEFSDASARAREKFDALKSEGLDAQKKALEKAGAEGAGIMEKARAEIRAESEKARGKLREDVEKFSEEIVGKLVKV
jgi:F-type H+-transporting ATPase subunit b